MPCATGSTANKTAATSRRQHMLNQQPCCRNERQDHPVAHHQEPLLEQQARRKEHSQQHQPLLGQLARRKGHSQERGGEDPGNKGEEAGDGEDVALVSDGVVEHLEGPHVPLQLEHADQPTRPDLKKARRGGGARATAGTHRNLVVVTFGVVVVEAAAVFESIGSGACRSSLLLLSLCLKSSV